MRSSANTPITLRRLGRLAAGLVLYGISIALMLRAGLGVDSWDVLHQGGSPWPWVSRSDGW